jgi:glycosyltransferase involved in cell wall biosynthesis
MAALAVNEGHVLSRGGSRARDVAVVTLPAGPVQAYDVELTALRGLPPTGGERARILVRAHGVPITLGAVEVPPEGLEPAGVAERLAAVLGDVEFDSTDLERLARRDHLAEHGPHLTVQIATKDRPAPLRRCLDSIAGLRYRSFDVIVVDNAPRSGETAAAVREWERANPTVCVRYLQEPVPGAARAHNRALAVAEGAWVVRTDDDVVVDPEWLAAIAEAATSAPGVECVTGLILPAEIATPAQELLEQFGGYARGFRRRRVDLGEHCPADPLFPFTTGRLGSGANIAFDAAKLRARGGFDPALGPGTRARGGEDLLAVFDVLTGGGGVVYEPSALVWHWNRRDLASLRRLMHDYGIGLSAYLTAAAMRQPRLALGKSRHVAAGVRHVVGRSSPKNKAKRQDYPKDLERRELLGMVAGPAADLAGRLGRRGATPVAPIERSTEVVP